MVTLVIGQIIHQRNNDRIWQITGQAVRSLGGNPRWRITLLTPSPSPEGDDRMAGEYTDCTENWLHTYCEDWPDTIEPPCGDGVQVVRICLPNRRIVTESLFHKAADAVAYCAAQLAERRDDHAEWYGWLVEAAEQLPDMVARLNDDGELVWKEVVHTI